MLNKSPSQPVRIRNTERQTINSTISNQKYDLYFHFPRTYQGSEINKRYPVLYILNGQWDFSLMIGCYGNPYFDGLIPEIILVGISWHGKRTDSEYSNFGLRDFTTREIDDISCGGAPQFADIIEKEIIPFVENRYPVTKDRGLVGASISGFFAFYLMFHKANLFSKFIISSPTVNWDKGILLYFESLFRKKSNTVKLDIYVCYGQLEDSTYIKKLIQQLKYDEYNHFNVMAEEIKYVGHAGNKPIGFARGLTYIYKRKGYKFSKKQLHELVGTYSSSNYILYVGLNRNGLIMKVNDSALEIELLAETESFFYVNGTYIFLEFNKEPNKINLKLEMWSEIIEVVKYR